MMLAAMLAVAMLAASPALAQDEPAVVADAKAKTATAGGAKAEADCKDEMIEAKAGGVVAKAPCKPEPPKAAPAPPPPPKAAAPAPPPPPKAAAPAPPPKAPAPAPAPAPKELPKTGGSSAASLFALGAGALLVGGGLLARRLVR
jgi:LPXTG-motif cell wall-anchored protein